MLGLFQNIRFIDGLLSVNLIEQVYVKLKTENIKDVLEYLLRPKKNNKEKLKYTTWNVCCCCRFVLAWLYFS